MAWTAGDYGGYHVMYTGFTPAVQNNATEIDFSDFTKIHFTLGSVTSGATIQLKIVSTGYADKTIDLAEGENNILFSTIAGDIDITKVTEMSMWATGTDAGTAVITNVYMQTVKNVASNSFGDEISTLDYITPGVNKFVMALGNEVMYYEDRNAAKADINEIPVSSYYYYVLINVPGLDTDNDGNTESDNYAIKVVNAEGNDFPGQYGLGNKINVTSWGDLFTACAQSEAHGEHAADNYGHDVKYGGLWKITYSSENNGFAFRNVGNGKYLTIVGTQDAIAYVKLYKSITVNVNSEFDKEDNEANDAIFAFANATGYDAATGTLTNGGWTFATPVDVSNWDYLVITTIDNASDGSRKITITDDNGVSVTGDQYSGSDAGTVKDMYLDQWNNQNAIRISIDYLRATKGMDISKIKSLTFVNNSGSGDCVFRISNVYLTDYNNTKIAGGYCEGDVKREYSATGKFGTICLPYKASYSGCEIYSIVNGNASGITLSKVSGLLEAGKPYFYMSADANGQNNAGSVRNVNFFRADLDTYDAASAGSDNGLIGTFTGINPLAPNDNYYVLSNNALYKVDAAATDTKAVKVGANKAYIDMSQVPASAPGLGTITLDVFGGTTGISQIENGKVRHESVYNLAGQRVAQPTKGLYIVNGKKVIIK